MRKIIFLIFFFCTVSCEDNEVQDVLPEVKVNVNISLNLPQYIALQTPSGWAYTNGGIKGIIIQNIGIGSPPYKAFERACPNYDCNSPMTFDGSLRMSCPCDQSDYSIIDGSPQTSGNFHFAREYKVNIVNNATLNITNF